MLDSPITQSDFARLVCVSRQAIHKQVDKGVLTEGHTCRQWLAAYISHLREEAAGRGGDHQTLLTLARIEESKENTAEKRQRRLTAAGGLLVREDVETMILELPGYVQSAVLNAGDGIIEALESKYSIEIDDEIITKPLRSALGHAANRAEELQRTLSGDL